MTEQPDIPTTPPPDAGEPGAGRVSRRHLLGGAGLLGLGAAAGAVAATAIQSKGAGVTERPQTAADGPRSNTVPRASGNPRPPNQPLNVILVIRDQTRFDLPAAAGYTTPALDRLAQQGITFRN
ncbi:MAG: Sulfatase, partial [Mycobacterium sp.]|nr:Sulfatase [Mycobacterium sp.]